MTKVYELKSCGYKIDVVPEYGMNCIKLTHDKPSANVLKTPQNVDILANDDAFLFGIPVLFFPNRISGGKFEFEGREYKFPINEPKHNNFLHGDLHGLSFDVTEYDLKHIKGTYTAICKNSYMTFPHSFEFSIEYSIERGRVNQIVSIKNTSNENMPVALGFHTTFNLSETTELKIPAERFAERNMTNYLPTGNFFDDFDLKDTLNDGTYKPFGKPVSMLFKLGGKNIEIHDRQKRTKVLYGFDEKFKYCMLFSRNGKDHICIEPQTWLSNCPNIVGEREKYGFDYIAPNDIKIYNSFLSVEEF